MRGALAVLIVLAVPAGAEESDALAPSLRLLAMKDGEVTLTPRVKVGERFQVVVTVTHRPDVVVGMPAAFDTGVFEVLDRRETTHPTLPERTFHLNVVAWQPGRQTFPPVPITYVPKGQGELRQIATGGLDVDVVAVLPIEEERPIDLAPIAAPVEVYEKDWRLVIAAGAAGATALAGSAMILALRRVRRRRAQRRAAEPIVDLRPPHEIAIEKLRALASSPLLDEADRRPFYFAMTEVVRDYLGRRFGFAALDTTTSELLEALVEAPEGLRADVARWFGDCDLVKFARLPASREDARDALDEAFGTIERSVRAAEPAPPTTLVGASDGH